MSSTIVELGDNDGDNDGDNEVEAIRPMRAFEVRVGAARLLTPHFLRITFTGPELDLFGSNADGLTLDLRIKLLIPSPGHALPQLRSVHGSLSDDWYQQWRSLDESTRGVMRTYTVRALRPGELDVDFVLHLGGDSGPAAEWAAAARPGDPMTLIGPCARWGDCLGIEFAPGDPQRVLLVGDETAVPAIAAILESLPPHVRGHAVLEVPTAEDFLDMSTAAKVDIRWHARNGNAHGEALERDVRTVVVPAACLRGKEPDDVDVDATILWETPGTVPTAGLYAWIAGEAATVRELRRYLVSEVGMNRNAVAFMGYWRQGRALPE
ncbi:siderophore-interacting protein [Arthrobacter sp. AQ5-05]|uniref:siderophore-interacting protein n=1 Tax=Arthrobacter sp. AQ5-05 TaxID=2184581 RepID=UPI0012B58F82|nr:siderophore-interacting protein [Arthrobacter sp. AQ5-05]